MPIEKITQRIFSDAKKEAAKLKKKAEEEANKILREALAEAEKKGAVLLEKAKIRAQEEKKRILALARLQSRDLVLTEKSQAVELAFQQALEKVLSLPDEEYLALMEKMLLEAVQTGEEEVIVSPKDKKRNDQDFLNAVNRKLVDRGKRGDLKLAAEARDLKGGFVLKAGGVETNSSLPVLIEALRDELEVEVVKVLLKRGKL